MKIFLIPHNQLHNHLWFCPRGSHIVKQGLSDNGVELVNSYDECDFAILDHWPQINLVKDNSYIQPFEHKLVCIDWIDEPDQFIYPPELCRAYFKRSYCLPIGNYQQELVTSRKEIDNERVLPFAYCALREFDIHPDNELSNRPITLGCFLRTTCPNRWWTLQVVEQIAKQLGVTYHIGPVNDSSRSVGTTCHYDSEYLNYLANTQIVITSQPTGWEGDSRLWESIMSNALVFTDKIYTPYNGRPENKKQVIEFQIGEPNSLIEPLQYYLNNLSEAQFIANEGKQHISINNTPKARMKEVLDFLENLL